MNHHTWISLATLTLASAAQAAQLLVPVDYLTIQQAVDAAVDGDEILIAPGVYQGAGGSVPVVDLLGKSLTLRATGSVDETIIDGGGSGIGISQTGQAATVWIEGITVRNAGGALWCHGNGEDRVWILDCRFTDLVSYGIYLEGHESAKISGCQITDVGFAGVIRAALQVRDCNALTLMETEIRDNGTFGLVIGNSVAQIADCDIERNGVSLAGSGNDEYAGGITGLEHSDISISNCLISDNRAKQSGGIRVFGGVLEIYDSSVNENIGGMPGSWHVGKGAGVHVYGGELTMHDSQIQSNRAASGAGGGVCVSEGAAHVERCVFEGNEAECGGGLWLASSALTLVDCRIDRNVGDTDGGGVLATASGMHETSLTLTRCVVYGNKSSRGGGLYAKDSEIRMDECTVTDNYANERGGGWFVTGARSAVTLQDCTARGNLAWNMLDSASQCAGGAAFCEAGGSMDISLCRFESNAGQYAGGAVHVSGASLNVTETTFYNHYAGGLGGTLLVESGGVLDMSGCMVMSGNTGDGGHGGGLYVDADNSSPATVESSAFCGNEVGGSTFDPGEIQNIVGPWIDAGGNDFRDWCVLSVDDDGADDPDADFAVIQDAVSAIPQYWKVEVHPGRYVGTGDEVISVDSRGRDIRIVAVGGPEVTIIDGEGVRRGVTCLGEDYEEGVSGVDGITIEGFSIVNGYAPSGGGVSSVHCLLTLKTCVLRENVAQWQGGGLWSDSCVATELFSCVVDQNRATNWYGGGIVCKRGKLHVQDCEVSDNVSQTWAGGVQASDSEVYITRCEFKGNQGDLGGAIGIDTGSAEVKQCLIANNVAYRYGGGMYANNASVLVEDCQIVRNQGAWDGGLHAESDSEFQVQSSNFCGNLPDDINGPWSDLAENWFSDECCDADINGDLVVDGADLVDLIETWGPCDGCGADLDDSASVDVEDLLFLFARWGSDCGG